MKILADHELPPLQPQDHPEPHSFAWTEQEMRAIRARDRLVEAAVLAKLREQEPVAYGMLDTQLGRKHRLMMVRLDKGQDGCTLPLYAAPLPAVVQVPQGNDLWAGKIAYQLTKRLVIDMPTARAAVDAALAAASGAPAQAIPAPWREATEEDAYEMGTKGAPATEQERKLFEAWMRGHCWALCAHWDGSGYVSDAEQSGYLDPRAMVTRQLWAAWRDRAALAQPSVPAPWREAVKVAREALRPLLDHSMVALTDETMAAPMSVEAWEAGRAALAQLDALEGGE